MELRKNCRDSQFLQWLNSLLFCLSILIKAYGDAMLAQKRDWFLSDDIKYVLLILATVLGMLMITKTQKYQLLQKETNSFLLLIFVWFVISIIASFFNTYFHIITIKYWFYIILPFVYAYSVIKTSTLPLIINCFKAALIICFICYVFVEKGTSLFKIDNFLLISYTDSYSPFESSYSAGTAVALCAFFGYYRKGNGFWLALSMLFCFLTFKRAPILMMFIYFLLPVLTNKNRLISKKWVTGFKIFFIISPILLSILFKPAMISWFENTWHLSLDRFMMGRINLYHILLNSNYKLSGLGTTLGYMDYATGKPSGIELELTQLYLEVGIVGLALFVNYCFNLANRHLYCMALICYTMFNMLTSSSMGNPFSWIFLYLTIWCIQYKTPQHINEDNLKEKETAKGADILCALQKK